MQYRSKRAGAVLAAALALILSGCAFSTDKADPKTAKKRVVLITHDSWAMDKKVLADFTKKTGYTLTVRPQGDAGEVTNKLVLTKGNPLGDAVFGIDNTFASRATDAGVIDGRLTPIDYGDVCINVDTTWYAKRNLTPPANLDDLTKKKYAGQLVVPAATTSSPGFAFLLATIGAKGDAWPAYWRKLVANRVKVDAGWTEAYENDFTAGGKGTRPIVLSYASSIPFTIPKGKTKPTTTALLNTCFRQTEYAGVLTDAANPQGAKALVEFMRSVEFQRALPDQMYVFPIVTGTPLPVDWARWAKVAPHPFDVPAAEITANREKWLTEWRGIVSGS